MSSFRTQYLSFLQSLKDVFPEHKKQFVEETIRVHDDNDDALVLRVMKTMRPIIAPVRSRDFDKLRTMNEPIVGSITLSSLLFAEGVTESTQQAMLSHIQTLYLLGAHMFEFDLSGTDAQATFHNFLEEFQSITDEEMGEAVKEHSKELLAMFHNLTKHMEDVQTTAGGVDLSGSVTGVPALDSLLSGKIGQLAQSIASEIDPEEFGLGTLEELSSPQDVIGKILKKPQNLMKMVKKVGTKVQDKIKKGEINQKELMAEATSMIDQLEGNELFQSMMSKMNPAMIRKMKAVDRMRKKQQGKNGGGGSSGGAGTGNNSDDRSIEELMAFIGGDITEPTSGKKQKKKKSRK